MTQSKDNPFIPEYPAGKFFTGRERQLKQLSELLDGLLRGASANLHVVGRGGEGKTSYLDKIVAEARQRNIIAIKSTPDLQKPAEANIGTIIKSLLREIERCTEQNQLEKDWESGPLSTFRTPRNTEVISEDLTIDFKKILGLLPSAGPKCCVICIDEGQRIHPIALSALKNALQPVGPGYMIVISLLNEDKNLRNEDAGVSMLDDLAARSGDPGASRFFRYNAAALGPFDSQLEAEECIRKRLENNIISFSDIVITQIPKIMSRHPAKIVALSKVVYEFAREQSLVLADEQTLRSAFTNKYIADVTNAIKFAQKLPHTDKLTYKAALRREGVFTPLQLANELASSTGERMPTDQLVDDIERALSKLVQCSYGLKEGDREYRLSESISVYALQLALET